MGVVVSSKARPIQDARIRRVCDLSGISQAQGKLATLEHLKKSIDISLRELERAEGRERIANGMVAALTFVKATCDAFIGMAAALSEAPGVRGEAAGLVKGIYSTTAVVTDAAVRGVIGEPVDWAYAITDAGNKATDVIGNKEVKFLAKNLADKIEIGTAAIKGDRPRVIAKSKDYARDIVNYTLDQLNNQKAGAVKAYIDLSKEAFSYNEELEKIVDTMIDSREETERRFQSARINFKRQTMRLTDKIIAIQKLLVECGVEAPNPAGAA